MTSLLQSLLGSPGIRRHRARGSVAAGFETCESRNLLSGIAIYPQPAAEVASLGSDVTPSRLPFDYSGCWCIEGHITDEIDGEPQPTAQGPYFSAKFDIEQERKQLSVLINYNGMEIPATGVVRGHNARIEFTFEYEGYKISTTLQRFNLEMFNFDQIFGVGRVKVTDPEGNKTKINLQFTGYRCEGEEQPG